MKVKKVKVYVSREARNMPASAFVDGTFCPATGRLVSRVVRYRGQLVPEFWWIEYQAPDGSLFLGNYA